jgi:hypothetical protein
MSASGVACGAWPFCGPWRPPPSVTAWSVGLDTLSDQGRNAGERVSRRAGDENRTRIASLEAPPEDDWYEQAFVLVVVNRGARHRV